LSVIRFAEYELSLTFHSPGHLIKFKSSTNILLFVMLSGKTSQVHDVPKIVSHSRGLEISHVRSQR